MTGGPVRRWLGRARGDAREGRLVVELHQDAPAAPPAISPAPAPPAPDWTGAVGQLRSVAQWIIGGVVATAAGVFAGSTLTRLGSLTPADDWPRLLLALGGACVGFLGIGLILLRGLEVLAPTGNSLPLLASAAPGSVLHKARTFLYRLNDIDETVYPLAKLFERRDTKAGIAYLPMLYASASFCVVRTRFDLLLARMLICVPLAILGFGVFAWAANPPDKPAPPVRGIEVRITG